ncbi:ABC transporter permease [Thioclava sp. GXIMD4215]|uniref:ABC transporter permease n=1 Tax=Thioclava sp. GXIMD4215 TaxID=3131928 RepID=UPI00325139BC
MTSRLDYKPAVLLSTPALVAIMPFLAACLYVLRFSFSADESSIAGFSVSSYQGLADTYFLSALGLTLKLAVFSTVLVLVLAVPLAFLLATTRSPFLRRMLTVAILLPMILNLLIQAYGWIILLGPTGVLNTVLRSTGLITRPLFLLFNETGVLIGLVQTALPLAVFPILSATRAVSRECLEAAASLGAGHWRTLFDITLPVLRPGLIGAASIVFAFNASAFAIPLLLGGRRVQMLGVVIRDMISPMFNWSSAAAAGVVLIAITTLALVLASWATNRSAKKEVR